jgi:hypothetical protein
VELIHFVHQLPPLGSDLSLANVDGGAVASRSHHDVQASLRVPSTGFAKVQPSESMDQQ